MNAAIGQMWMAFYSNLGGGLVGATECKTFGFIRCSLMSIASWRWGRWPYSKCIASKLDSAQSHFVQNLFPRAQKPGEPADEFFKQKRLQAGRLSSKMGKWSQFRVGAIKA